MKYIAALTGLLLTSIATAAFAVPGNDCAARSEKVAVTEKDDFLKACLAEASAPAKITEAKHKHKKARCEQNAKNMKLQGKDKGEYQEDCLNKNQAAEVKSNIAVADASATPAANDSQKSTSPKAAEQKHVEKKHAAKKQKEHKKASKKNSKKAVKLSPAASGVAETK